MATPRPFGFGRLRPRAIGLGLGVGLGLAACGARPEAAAGPWTLTVSNGSADQTEIHFDGQAARWRYRPVRPEESSSGFYSGGAPAEGALDAAAARALWAAVQVPLQALPEADGPRPKGAARVELAAGAARQVWVVPMGAAHDAVLAPINALRAGP